MEDLLINTAAEALLERSLSFLSGLVEFLLAEVGDRVDVVSSRTTWACRTGPTSARLSTAGW